MMVQIIHVDEWCTGAPMHDLEGHLDRVNSCCFHPIFQELYTGANDHQILRWVPVRDEVIVPEDGEEAAAVLVDEDEWSDEDS